MTTYAKARQLDSPTLSKRLRPSDFFSIGFGAIIGVGWVLVMGDWLNMGGGPITTIMAFALGAAILIPIALVYGELTTAVPVAGGPIAFALKAFGHRVSYLTGWFLTLGYVMLCPWEAIAVGELAGALFPMLKFAPLYSVGGDIIYAPILAISLAIGMCVIAANFKGVRYVSVLQKLLTFGMVVIWLIALAASVFRGSMSNLLPIVGRTGMNPNASILTGLLAVISISPFFYSGFDTIAQGVEESSVNINPRSLGRVTAFSILAAAVYYITIIVSVSMTVPWQDAISLTMPASKAYEVGLGLPSVSAAILFGGLCGLITSLNSFFLAGARVLLAMGRARMLMNGLSRIHPVSKTPYVANLFIACLTLLGPFLGRSMIAPIVNVCSLSFMMGWLAVCCSSVRIRSKCPTLRRPYEVLGGKVMEYASVVLAILMILILVLPMSPGALRWPLEWIIVLVWAGIGLLLYCMSLPQINSISEDERKRLVLGEFAS